MTDVSVERTEKAVGARECAHLCCPEKKGGIGGGAW